MISADAVSTLPSSSVHLSSNFPLSVAVAQQTWERLGLNIVQGYGLSEVTNFSCQMPTELPADEYARWMLAGRRTSVGPVLPGQIVEIKDGPGLAAAGAEGEVIIRGPCAMSGYLYDPVATEQAFSGGWFHTGDLGYWLPDDMGRKYIHISGRIREIAKRSGVLVSLLELDDVLISIPDVVDAGSAAFANTWVDEEIGALVVRRPGSMLTGDRVIESCRRVLGFAAVPKCVEFVDEIPRTASGKIRRLEISKRFIEYRDRLFVEDRSTRGRPTATLRAGTATKETLWNLGTYSSIECWNAQTAWLVPRFRCHQVTIYHLRNSVSTP